MITKLGIFTLLAGSFVALFSRISQFFETNTFWVDLTISKIIGQENAGTIILLTDNSTVQNIFDFILYDYPFYGFLIGIGFTLLTISLFMKRH